MKTAERERARRLRQEQGASVKELARLLGVSKSSVSLWVRDIELTEEQHAALRRRMGGRIDGSKENAIRALERRRAAQDCGREAVRRNDPLVVAGCMLFWAEGSRSRNTMVFTNSDPEMVKFFLRFLRDCLEVPDGKVPLTCNFFADHAKRQRELESFWLELLTVCDTRLVQSLYGAIQEYGGFEREKWVL